MTLEDAFASSSNVAAVRLFNEVGSERVIRMARSLGVTSPMPEGDPSLALGTSSMTLLELTSAYAGVAANQFPVKPYAFAPEEESWWEWLTTPSDSASSRTHEDIERMLRAAINRGTGRAATLPIANFGKTGTTQNNRDALFVGYAGDLVVGVWVGNDDNTSLGSVSGRPGFSPSPPLSYSLLTRFRSWRPALACRSVPSRCCCTLYDSIFGPEGGDFCASWYPCR